MFNYINTLNWGSIALAFIIYFVLGALWFTTIFKKSYEEALGKVGQLPDRPKPIFVVGPAICTFIITFTTAILINVLDISSLFSTIEFASIVGIGYLVANTVNIAINPNIPNPLHYSVITGSYHLLGIYIISFVLVYMR
ncbi:MULTISPECIES: DUF1761 domain-containing protein [Sphingobacterium]|uniref:DUF1761 domain-containing protein n=1 Tax=Sphingobacterium populi TaxID=1812824 RepID=A0ABW5UBM5_9SPHI|nr:DUF1761 domain-containing protein [Sphingobacterium sp. CFCC 11742]